MGLSSPQSGEEAGRKDMFGRREKGLLFHPPMFISSHPNRTILLHFYSLSLFSPDYSPLVSFFLLWLFLLFLSFARKSPIVLNLRVEEGVGKNCFLLPPLGLRELCAIHNVMALIFAHILRRCVAGLRLLGSPKRKKKRGGVGEQKDKSKFDTESADISAFLFLLPPFLLLPLSMFLGRYHEEPPSLPAQLPLLFHFPILAHMQQGLS